MSKNEEKEGFVSFLEEKFLEYVHDTGRLRKHRHFGEFGYHIDSSIDVYERVNTVLRAQQGRNADDVGDIFTHKYLKETVSRIDGHYSNTHSYIQDLGYLDLVNDHFDIIAENVTMDMLPREDLEIMRMLGSENPERTARAAIFSLRSISKTRRQNEMYNIKSIFSEGGKRIHSVRTQYEESRPTKGEKDHMDKKGRMPPDSPKPPRKW